MPANTVSSQFFPRVVIFSEYTSLTSKIIDIILKNDCKVVVVCNEPYKYFENKHELSDLLSIVERKHFILDVKIEYLLYIDDLVSTNKFLTNENSKNNNLDLQVQIIEKNDPKTLFIFPYQIPTLCFDDMSASIESLTKVTKNILFIGNSESQVVIENGIFVSDKYYFRNDDIDSREIVRSLFSFSGSKNKHALLSDPINSSEITLPKLSTQNLIITDEIEDVNFYKIDKEKIIKNLDSQINNETKPVLELRRVMTLLTDESQLANDIKSPNHDFSINFSKVDSIDKPIDTNQPRKKINLSFLRKDKSKNSSPKKIISPFRRKDKSKKTDLLIKKKPHSVSKAKNYMLFIFTSLVLISFLPYLILFMNFIFLYLHLNFNMNPKYAYSSSTNGLKLTSRIAHIPYLQQIYSPSHESFEFINKISEINIVKTSLDKHLSDVFTKIYSSESIDGYHYDEIDSSYEKIFTLSNFIKAESVNDYFGIVSKLDESGDVYAQWKFASNLKNILGEKDPMKYAVVLLDNGYIRPSGGTPESVLIVSVSKGKITNYKISSVSELDGQLNGLVEFPDELLNYQFKEESWSLRESFWFTDVKESAKAALWFIQKEDKVELDGLIAIDTQTMNLLLEDLSLTVSDSNEDNLLEFVTQVFKNRQFADKSNQILVDAIFERHINVYFTNSIIQNTFEDLIKNSLYQSECNKVKCEHYPFGFFESNSEPTYRSNISRKSNIDMSLDNDILTTTFNVTITNNLSNEESGSYKSMVGVVSPNNSKLVSITTTSELFGDISSTPKRYQDESKSLNTFDLNILPNDKITISTTFQSSVDFSDNDGFSLNYIHQPGIEPYPVGFKLKNSNDMEVNRLNSNTDLMLSLTDDGVVSYNSPTSHDFFFELLWK